MKLLERYTNSYGNIDISQKLDSRLVHLRHRNAKNTARSLKADFRPALVGFKEYLNRKWAPIVDGIVCTKPVAERIKKQIAAKEAQKLEKEKRWVGNFDASTSHQQHADILHALYTINKEAKRLRDVKTSSWYSQSKAKHYHIKKAKKRSQELYDLKDCVISIISDKASRVELHQVNDREMYCYYFGELSFHSFVSSGVTVKTDKTIDGKFSAENEIGGMQFRKAEVLLRHFIQNMNANERIEVVDSELCLSS